MRNSEIRLMPLNLVRLSTVASRAGLLPARRRMSSPRGPAQTMESLESRRLLSRAPLIPTHDAGDAPIESTSTKAEPTPTPSSYTAARLTLTPDPGGGDGNITPIGKPDLRHRHCQPRRDDAHRPLAAGGQPLHVEATGTVIPGADLEDARFRWDFGDAGSRYNQMDGFNAAHVYDRPGTYTVRLTVTAPAASRAPPRSA
jgi:hypothetical protein